MSSAYLWVFASVVFAVVGDYFAKLWSTNLSIRVYIATLLCYLIGGTLYMPVLLKENLVTTALIWSLLNIIGFSFIGFYLFEEHISTIQMIGMGFGVIAIILLTMGH